MVPPLLKAKKTYVSAGLSKCGFSQLNWPSLATLIDRIIIVRGANNVNFPKHFQITQHPGFRTFAISTLFDNPKPCGARVLDALLHSPSTTGTEELSHLEMVGTLVHQLTRNLSIEEIKKAGFDAYFVDHTAGVYPQFASGTPWTAATIGVKGDVITDLTEDMGAEQKARTTYDNILRLSDDPDVNEVIRFLREREVVHFQRFGEALRIATEKLDQKNVYAVNPAFDKIG